MGEAKRDDGPQAYMVGEELEVKNVPCIGGGRITIRVRATPRGCLVTEVVPMTDAEMCERLDVADIKHTIAPTMYKTETRGQG